MWGSCLVWRVWTNWENRVLRSCDIEEFCTNLSGFNFRKQSICSCLNPPWRWGTEREINKCLTFLTRPNLCALLRMQLLKGKITYIFPPTEQEQVIFSHIHSEMTPLLYFVNNNSSQRRFHTVFVQGTKEKRSHLRIKGKEQWH